MNDEDFNQRLKSTAAAVNQHLELLLQDQTLPGERTRPPRLMAAMRHGVLNGGKRLRPFLVLETAALFGVSQSQSMQTACALECLHSYSLVHDDLPAMDDDDVRRGQPTVHKAFDEALAILAGDALLTLSFDLITDSSNHANANIRVNLANLLARASGLGGMIGGQVLDIEAESGAPDESAIRTLQAMKTGALIRFACEAGAVLGGADEIVKAKLIRYGEIIGLAFQLADDVLDVTSDAATMGKAVNKDADRGKGTLVGIHGVEKIRGELAKLVEEAHNCLADFGPEAECLRQTARFIVERKN